VVGVGVVPGEVDRCQIGPWVTRGQENAHAPIVARPRGARRAGMMATDAGEPWVPGHAR
jgi:hypothetical protein